MVCTFHFDIGLDIGWRNRKQGVILNENANHDRGIVPIKMAMTYYA
jgi:hypothetical protein